MHNIEEHQVRGHPGGRARRPGGDTGEPHPLLEPLEVAPSLAVERDDLTVQHGGAPAEGLGEGKELRVGGGDVRPRTGAHEDRAVARQVDHGPLAVLLHLERLPVLDRR